MIARILSAIMVPFIILFGGLSVAYSWAIPLTIGSIVIMSIFLWEDSSERKYF